MYLKTLFKKEFYLTLLTVEQVSVLAFGNDEEYSPAPKPTLINNCMVNTEAPDGVCLLNINLNLYCRSPGENNKLTRVSSGLNTHYKLNGFFIWTGI